MSSYNPFKLRQQLEKHESKRNMLYDDATGLHLRPGDTVKGKITGGIGHNFSDDGISESVISACYDEDVADAITVLSKYCPSWVSLDEVRQRALIDLAFNLGSRLRGFPRFLADVATQSWALAADELQHSEPWFTEVGQRGKDLVWMIRTGTDPVA